MKNKAKAICEVENSTGVLTRFLALVSWLNSSSVNCSLISYAYDIFNSFLDAVHFGKCIPRQRWPLSSIMNVPVAGLNSVDDCMKQLLTQP